MEEQLLEYSLGTLDPVTHARVEKWLGSDPAARARLDILRRALEPLATLEDAPPPPGLVLRTLALIAEHETARPESRTATRQLPEAPVPSPAQTVTGSWRWLRRADLLVAAVMLFVTGGLLLPFVVQQWQEQQRQSCANNMRKFWTGLAAHADLHEGQFPRVENEGPRSVAGIFVPVLASMGLLEDTTSIGCPARGSQPLPTSSVADLDRLYRESPGEFQKLASNLAGDYAYSLGYQNGNLLTGLCRNSGDTLPILADCGGSAGHNSSNHGGRGQNVLYVGGNLRWCSHPAVGEGSDHIYINQHQRVEAGVCRTDSVLGASATRPHQGD